MKRLDNGHYAITDRYTALQNPYKDWMIYDNSKDDYVFDGCDVLFCETVADAICYLIEGGFLKIVEVPDVQ